MNKNCLLIQRTNNFKPSPLAPSAEEPKKYFSKLETRFYLPYPNGKIKLNGNIYEEEFSLLKSFINSHMKEITHIHITGFSSQPSGGDLNDELSKKNRNLAYGRSKNEKDNVFRLIGESSVGRIKLTTSARASVRNENCDGKLLVRQRKTVLGRELS